MRKKNVTPRLFKCLECNTTQIAYKMSNHLTKPGHLKDMYCWFCQEDRKLIQLPKYYL